MSIGEAVWESKSMDVESFNQRLVEASAFGHFKDNGSNGDTPPLGLTMRCSNPWAAKMS
jgi:hypothetical protein